MTKKTLAKEIFVKEPKYGWKTFSHYETINGDKFKRHWIFPNQPKPHIGDVYYLIKRLKNTHSSAEWRFEIFEHTITKDTWYYYIEQNRVEPKTSFRKSWIVVKV